MSQRVAVVVSHIEIKGTSYVYDKSREQDLATLAGQVREMRAPGKLSPDVLPRIRQHFRIKHIYHSSAIEGNALAVGETREVVENGLTISGKPLKDQAEARNLSHALDFLEKLASDAHMPITEHDVRQIHALVLAGISDEAGKYRSVPVAISGSNYSPTGPESIPVNMEKFGRWLSGISVPSNDSFAGIEGLLVAVAAHAWFVTEHPFIDGNGRVARLLMNLMLMRYGYPIAIITKEDRPRYYDALEFSQASDLTPFLVLVTECVEETLEEYEAAVAEEREKDGWAASLGAKLSQPERIRAHNEYEVWRSAMDLLKNNFKRTVDVLDQAADFGKFGKISLKNFDSLEFEKYSNLRRRESAKRTWFFCIDFRSGEKVVRYLFFFGYASKAMRSRCDVTLYVSREEPPNSFFYERLDSIQAPNVPDFVEVGYEMSKERLAVRTRNNRVKVVERVEVFTKQFFEAVVAKHFAG